MQQYWLKKENCTKMYIHVMIQVVDHSQIMASHGQNVDVIP